MMNLRNITVAMWIAAGLSLSACGRQQADLGRPDATADLVTPDESKEDRAALDTYIESLSRPIGARSRPVMPTEAERALASYLDPAVLVAVEAYIETHGIHSKAKGRKPKIVAVRAVHGFLLLDIQFRTANALLIDGNVHLVYSPTRRAVVDRFTWYLQG